MFYSLKSQPAKQDKSSAFFFFVISQRRNLFVEPNVEVCTSSTAHNVVFQQVPNISARLVILTLSGFHSCVIFRLLSHSLAVDGWVWSEGSGWRMNLVNLLAWWIRTSRFLIVRNSQNANIKCVFSTFYARPRGLCK